LAAALVRLARLPPEAGLGLQKSPLDLVRSGMVLRSMLPAMETRAAVLRAEISELASLRDELHFRYLETARLERELTERQSALAALIDKRAAQHARKEQERQGQAERIAALAAQAGSLREVIGRLERESALTRELPPFPAPETVFALVMPESQAGQAGSIWPVSGTIKEPFGHTDGQGGISRGVTIAAPANAVVISPLAGSVRFAGPFLNYKHILILEHAGGYHSLIAGLDRIDAVLGDAILAGEPVGAMGSSAEGGSDLYFELRQNGQPINPQQALATGAVKGSG
jgi:septal ring factor EnvC (AmiA/AmiB activator)